MNEMSINSSDHPIINPDQLSDKSTPMKAMLTSNGSIKIIISSSDESSGGEECHTDDSGVDSCAVKTSKSQSSKAASEVTDNSSTTFTSSAHNTPRIQEDDDDDDELSQYKQSPRAVFLSTVCHVSLLFTFIVLFI